MCHVTFSYVYTCYTQIRWNICYCDVCDSHTQGALYYVYHNTAFMHITTPQHTASRVIQTDTHELNESITGTGWRRLIGSPKLQIIFLKRATKYRSLLRKLTYKDKGSYESSPPCTPSSEGEG